MRMVDAEVLVQDDLGLTAAGHPGSSLHIYSISKLSPSVWLACICFVVLGIKARALCELHRQPTLFSTLASSELVLLP